MVFDDAMVIALSSKNYLLFSQISKSTVCPTNPASFSYKKRHIFLSADVIFSYDCDRKLPHVQSRDPPRDGRELPQLGRSGLEGGLGDVSEAQRGYLGPPT